jgi:hypothetical protein
MDDVRRRHRLRLFQLDRVGAEIVKQADAVTEQHRHKVDHHLIQQSGPHVLLGHFRAAHDIDILVARDCSGLGQSAFDAVGDEGERRLPRWVPAPGPGG